MDQRLIKICGIRNTLLLHELKTLGVNFIGLVFHPSSKRYVDLDTAKEISLAAKENNLLPVGVFVDQTAKEIEEICSHVQLKIVQLHGEHCRKQHHLLPEHYQRIYVQSVGQDGNIIPDPTNGLKYCDPSRDFLMFDSVRGGSGKTFNWEKFSYHGECIPIGFQGAGKAHAKSSRGACGLHVSSETSVQHSQNLKGDGYRWFLAGGLTPDNVAEAVELLQPNGVDVSGGVEDEFGQKDMNLIRQFVSSIK